MGKIKDGAKKLDFKTKHRVSESSLNGPNKKIFKAKHRGSENKLKGSKKNIKTNLLMNENSLEAQPIAKLLRNPSLKVKVFQPKVVGNVKKKSAKGKKTKISKRHARLKSEAAVNEEEATDVTLEKEETHFNFIPESVKTNLNPDAEKPVVLYSNNQVPKKSAWMNRNRVLIFGSRGIGVRDRHLMKDIIKLMPHARTESKMERRQDMVIVNEVCRMRNCNKCVLFEGRGGRDVYMWLSTIPNGPSVKFLLQNIYTMNELRFTGNCLIGSRPLLSFDETFDTNHHYHIFKELLTQIFGTPHKHPKSQPFFDHVFMFSIVDKKIWFRNYQILSEDGAISEIGPRFVLNPVKIFEGSFCGETLWQNPHYVTPAKIRHLLAANKAGKYVISKQSKKKYTEKKVMESYKFRETDEVFTGNPWEKAEELLSKDTEVGGHLKGKKLATYLSLPQKPKVSDPEKNKKKNKKLKRKFKK